MIKTRARSRPTAAPFSAADFFQQNPVFRREEFIAAHTASGAKASTSATLLRDYVKRGRILNLRRGLYSDAESDRIDPWVIGTKLTSDGVVAYDGALSFYKFTGLGHSMTVRSKERLSYFCCNEVIYRSVRAPRGASAFVEHKLDSGVVRVTSVEHTLVDMLDRPDLTTDGVEAWDHFIEAGPLDTEEMCRYAITLGNRLACSRLGFILRKLYRNAPPGLSELHKHRAKTTGYLFRTPRVKDNSFDRDWNLVVPWKLKEKMWNYLCAGFPAQRACPRDRFRDPASASTGASAIPF